MSHRQNRLKTCSFRLVGKPHMRSILYHDIYPIYSIYCLTIVLLCAILSYLVLFSAILQYLVLFRQSLLPQKGHCGRHITSGPSCRLQSKVFISFLETYFGCWISEFFIGSLILGVEYLFWSVFWVQSEMSNSAKTVPKLLEIVLNSVE